MSEENVEALKQALTEAPDQPDAFFALLDDDVVWDPGDFPSGKVYGPEGVREFFRQWLGAFEEFRSEALEYIDAGSAVFVHMRQWGRGKGSGATTHTDLWQVWIFLDRKVVRFVQKPDRRDALEAAGLADSDS
jgi:hypothetical protein